MLHSCKHLSPSKRLQALFNITEWVSSIAIIISHSSILTFFSAALALTRLMLTSCFKPHLFMQLCNSKAAAIFPVAMATRAWWMRNGHGPCRTELVWMQTLPQAYSTVYMEIGQFSFPPSSARLGRKREHASSFADVSLDAGAFDE